MPLHSNRIWNRCSSSSLTFISNGISEKCNNLILWIPFRCNLQRSPNAFGITDQANNHYRELEWVINEYFLLFYHATKMMLRIPFVKVERISRFLQTKGNCRWSKWFVPLEVSLLCEYKIWRLYVLKNVGVFVLVPLRDITIIFKDWKGISESLLTLS